MAKYKTVKVQIPEIDELELPDELRHQLDHLCAEYRAKQAEIDPLAEDAKKLKEQIDPLAKALAEQGLLPERTLGESWDLRRTERQNEKINKDRLKSWLLKLGLKLQVPCPKTVVVGVGEDGTAYVDICPYCNGEGIQTLDGVKAVLWLIEEVTDRSESVSWSVYGRDKSKETEKTA